jgi:hypothetical protein
MVRKQIYIKPEQDAAIKQKAADLGKSEAELIREYIDEGTQRPTPSEREQARREMLAFMDERAKMRVPQTGRKWTREELYDDR